MLCNHVHDDVSKVYHSVAVRDMVSQVAQTVIPVPENQVLPVVNHVKDLVLDVNTDVLILTALNQMIHAAQDYLQLNRSDKSS
jgi:bifunctional N-acetylglucosamine-1-phosphate-uridyltransferase/glucosamine-1-phosphate-acetyltransferase GlmU-like protein